MTGLGTALTALVNGSMILTGKLCGCAVHGVKLAWDAASTDIEATAKRQAKADRSAQQKARKARAADKRRRKGRDADEDDDDPEVQDDIADITAAPVTPVRRPVLESLGVLALGGALAAGAVSAVWRLIGDSIGEGWGVLAPYRFLIVTAGGLAWMAAAWMVAAPPAPNPKDDDLDDWDDEFEDDYDDQEDEDPEHVDAPVSAPDRGMALLLDVIRDLSDAEYAKRAGVHVDVLLDSAIANGHVPAGTEQAEFRAWLEAAGLPVEDKLGMRIEGKPVTRVGVRIDAATRALGMTPTQLLEARQETLLQTPARVPAQAAPQASAPALLRLIPGGLQTPSGPTPLPPSQEGAQGAR